MPEQVEESQGGDTETPCLVGVFCVFDHISPCLCVSCALCMCVCLPASPWLTVDELTPWCKEGTHWIRF